MYWKATQSNLNWLNRLRQGPLQDDTYRTKLNQENCLHYLLPTVRRLGHVRKWDKTLTQVDGLTNWVYV